mmetsp:Transcript_76358/g.159020  ORF Transcript_76358/g.159020 Transcript_76358/m.159020 type:complete len:212 (-) Transcript_76358:909-1544(-)|eukprot:CAMPEP_0206426232 /NCGR_PEP_ID=MMETSP0324_2-20121206/4250_1 /ASSEMBLY_ACC=CAM_ASM_000836 /TAXON_ID=2866 /ORGANISM="Crypthecodinium cohnii, Strain Seligo" /LENGTH=211 /DNA_ID=CAMNT_0053891137 /DNA_START=140 /DNA_END=775 /DNA_ORIENTATION=-
MNALRRFANAYDAHLRRRPLLVKMASSMIIVGSSDLVVQLSSGEPYDPIRTSILGIGYGAFHFAPMMHAITLGWKRILPNLSLGLVTFRSFVDQTTSFPFNTSVSLCWQHIARHHHEDLSLDYLKEKLPATVRENLWPSFQVGFFLWLPVGILNYKVIPVRYQVLFMNSVSFFWNAYMVWRYKHPARSELVGERGELLPTGIVAPAAAPAF